MDEISHMNFPNVGDLWTIDGIPVLIVVCTTDSGVRVCTQTTQSNTVEWDLSYTKDLSLQEFKRKLTHAEASADSHIAKVHPNAYKAYLEIAFKQSAEQSNEPSFLGEHYAEV
jgi:hypothetical protein